MSAVIDLERLLRYINELICEQQIRSKEVKVLLTILPHVNANGQILTRDHQRAAMVKDIADIAGLHKKHVGKALEQLCERGILQREPLGSIKLFSVSPQFRQAS
ncbi:hypothetical protein JI721_15100 [Alicyclobacillus cycloheptanicus]|uniref:DNA-binding MarR family transcriptional regulator n=1 Tax=Alicyclobacillus cycloheptanicus TaxID=1457 RepID=A0ABT9XDK3_9BACL|nr:hypothetical protein [Alicyclobacillus cycloheptanicus]MDQ0188267.1 DNA-binding MarR family transcriptional regulator [Alicyclobacillus cycloheptanicus]WDM00985.1 hypothetical protein JI721_15100 [Alicyclobacillus cycloheptanicus]